MIIRIAWNKITERLCAVTNDPGSGTQYVSFPEHARTELPGGTRLIIGPTLDEVQTMFGVLSDTAPHDPEVKTPSYHDLHVTTPDIPRTSLFNLEYGIVLTCSRVAGWTLYREGTPGVIYGKPRSIILGAEYDDPAKWLILDVGGIVILDSRGRETEDDDGD